MYTPTPLSVPSSPRSRSASHSNRSSISIDDSSGRSGGHGARLDMVDAGVLFHTYAFMLWLVVICARIGYDSGDEDSSVSMSAYSSPSQRLSDSFEPLMVDTTRRIELLKERSMSV